MTEVDATRFVEKFAGVWSALDPERFAQLWDAEGPLFHPSIARSQAEILDYLRRIQAMLPDIRLRVLHWTARDRGYLENAPLATG